MRGWLKNFGGNWRVRRGSFPPAPSVDETLAVWSCFSLTIRTNSSPRQRHHAAHCVIPTTLGVLLQSIGLELNWD